MKELEAQMQIIEVKSIDNMMELASTACKFSQFENVSRALLLNCAKFAEKNMSIPVSDNFANMLYLI